MVAAYADNLFHLHATVRRQVDFGEANVDYHPSATHRTTPSQVCTAFACAHGGLTRDLHVSPACQEVLEERYESKSSVSMVILETEATPPHTLPKSLRIASVMESPDFVRWFTAKLVHCDDVAPPVLRIGHDVRSLYFIGCAWVGVATHEDIGADRTLHLVAGSMFL